jgi:hypothetical protein
MAESGMSVSMLKVAGGWRSDSIAHGYIAGNLTVFNIITMINLSLLTLYLKNPT